MEYHCSGTDEQGVADEEPRSPASSLGIPEASFDGAWVDMLGDT